MCSRYIYLSPIVLGRSQCWKSKGRHPGLLRHDKESNVRPTQADDHGRNLPRIRGKGNLVLQHCRRFQIHLQSWQQPDQLLTAIVLQGQPEHHLPLLQFGGFLLRQEGSPQEGDRLNELERSGYPASWKVLIRSAQWWVSGEAFLIRLLDLKYLVLNYYHSIGTWLTWFLSITIQMGLICS